MSVGAEEINCREAELEARNSKLQVAKMFNNISGDFCPKKQSRYSNYYGKILYNFR